MESSQKSKKSNKARLYARWQEELKSMLSFLNTLSVSHLTDEQLQKLRIGLSDLNFSTGETSHTTPQYFKPTDQTGYQVDSNNIDPAEDMFMQSCKSKRRKVYGDTGWPEYLLDAFGKYRGALSSKYPSAWTFLFEDRGSPGYWNPYHSKVTRQYFCVSSACHIPGESKPHRLLKMFTDDRADESQLLVSELKAMISWMLGGMRDQVLARKAFKGGDMTTHHSTFHMIIPVLIISCLQPARARVLQGYFDGALRIQLTKLYDFNIPVPQYKNLMTSLIRWGEAIAQGNTTLKEPLSVISEDAEDEANASHSKLT